MGRCPRPATGISSSRRWRRRTLPRCSSRSSGASSSMSSLGARRSTRGSSPRPASTTRGSAPSRTSGRRPSPRRRSFGKARRRRTPARRPRRGADLACRPRALLERTPGARATSGSQGRPGALDRGGQPRLLHRGGATQRRVHPRLRARLLRWRAAPQGRAREHRRNLRPDRDRRLRPARLGLPDLRGTILTCTPSYAKYLAEYIREKFEVSPSDLGLSRILLGASRVVRSRRSASGSRTHTVPLSPRRLATPTSPGLCRHLRRADGNHFVAPDQIVLELDRPGDGRGARAGGRCRGRTGRNAHRPRLRAAVRFRPGPGDRETPPAVRAHGPRIRCVGRTDDMLIVAGVNVWPRRSAT